MPKRTRKGTSYQNKAILDEIPALVLSAMVCKKCGAGLFRGPTGWVCPVGLDHTGIIREYDVKEMIRGLREQMGWRYFYTDKALAILREAGRRNIIPRA